MGTHWFCTPEFRVRFPTDPPKINMIYERIGDKAQCPDCNKLFGVNGVQTHYRHAHTGWKNPNPGNKGKIQTVEQKLVTSARLKEHYKQNPRATADLTVFRNYQVNARFIFRLADYPNEFDFKLIESYGWYKAKNKGNNLLGVSRDHMVSVKYGFENNIPTEVIRHPSNCKLVRHNDNQKKQSLCSITIEELYNRIEEWNKRY